MDIVLIGTIQQLLETKTGNSNGKPWKKQAYLLNYGNGEHPHTLMFTIFGEEKINQYDIKQGDRVTVHLNIDAREYNGKWFNNVDAWMVTKDAVQNKQQEINSNNVQSQAPADPQADLPF